jgi:hypothetical protein
MMRVALVGFAPSWVDAPFADPAVAIWTMNYHHRSVPRTDAVFELHAWATVAAEDGGAHVAPLAALTCPVYMQTVRPEIPASVAYPIDQMRARYTLPGREQPYFTSTASYMVALAIEQDVDEIALYGIDLAHDSEYGTQRPSCEFFLGVAVGRGIRVVVHPRSDLLTTAFLYGYDDAARDWFRDRLTARRAELLARQAQHAHELEQHKAAVSEFNGALQDNEHILKTWVSR